MTDRAAIQSGLGDDIRRRQDVRFDADRHSSDDPHWSPDGQWIAYRGRVGEKSGLVIAKPDGSGATLLAEVAGTNAPLPGSSTSPT
jgi:Tol biopolymer transport system component